MSARSRRLDRYARRVRKLAAESMRLLQPYRPMLYAVSSYGRILGTSRDRANLHRLVHTGSVVVLRHGESVRIVTLAELQNL